MADITITGLTDGSLDINNDWAGAGVFDKLIEAVNKNIEGQYNKGRISGSDYANVYLGGMQAVLAQSMQYLLQADKVQEEIGLLQTQNSEMQLNGITDRLLKDKQVEKIQEEIDLLKTQDSEMKLNGIKQRAKLEEEIYLLQAQEEAEQYKVDNILPLEASKLEKDIDVSERQMAEAELTGAKQRTILDTEESIKQYEHDVLQLDQHNTSIKQQAILETEEEAKQYEVDNILPEQVNKIQEEIDLLQTQDSEMQLNGITDRLLKDKQTEKAQEEIDLLQTQDLEVQKSIDVKERQMLEAELTGTKQRAILDTEEEIKQYEHDVLQLDQHNKVLQDIDLTEQQVLQISEQRPKMLTKLEEEIDILQSQDLDIKKSTDVKERQMQEAESTGAKQRTLLDTEEEAKQYEVDKILPEQRAKLQEEIDLLQTQNSELNLNGIKDRLLKDSQIEKVAEEVDLLQTQDSEMILNGIKQREKIDEDITLIQTQESELRLNGTVDRSLKGKQTEKVQEEITTEEYGQTALAARVYDETSIRIDANNLDYPQNDQDTKHYWALKAAEADVVGKKQETSLVANKVKTEEANTKMAIGKMLQEYGMKASVTEYKCYDADGTDLGVHESNSIPQESVTEVPHKYAVTMDGLSTGALTAPDYETRAPATLLEAQLMKAATERDVSKRTSEGFEADTYYKVYRSLQELMFALANSGVVTDGTEEIYTKIVSSMQKTMNAQLSVWGGTCITDIDLSSTTPTTPTTPTTQDP
jgi:hypothetical protein